MKTMKRLQVATAAASLFALAGAAQAAIVNSTGSVIAIETIQPNATGPGVGNLSNVRAPAFTYSYEGGITVGAQSVQYFQIVSTISGNGDYAFTNATDPLVPAFGTNVVNTAQTIVAQLRGVGNTGRRIGVIGSTTPTTTVSGLPRADGGTGAFAIVLTEVRRGDHVVGSPTFDANVNSTKSVTYFFQLVNNTNSPVTLSALDLTFHTSKVAAGAATDYVAGSIVDSVTTASSEFGALFNLVPLVNAATGHQDGPFACYTPIDRVVSLQVISGEGVNPAIGPEPNNTAVGGASSTFVRNYLAAKRAIDVIVQKGTDRQIQTTNSFQTNQGSTPINGIGGTGGGRFTFKPTANETNAITNVYGGINNGNGTFTVTGVAAQNAAPNTRETHPLVAWSNDDRAARIATLTFSNRGVGLDRLLDVDAYQYRTQQGAPWLSTSPIPPGPAVAQGDFAQPSGGPAAPANVFGGVDVPGTGLAVQLKFSSKPNYAGFAGRTGTGTATSPFGLGAGTLALVRNLAPGTSTANQCGATLPATNRIVAVSGANFREFPAGSGNYEWSFSAADFVGADIAPSSTLLGDWHVCYYVPGNVNVPNTFFTNAVATLFKDDASEQTNVSCPAPMAFIQGGVKVDVRHYQAVTTADDWWSVVRVINNSERDTAVVEAQYIWDDGKYGLWGTLGTLAPRASMNLSSPVIATLLTTAPISLPAAQINTAVPRDTKTRLRIAADVSTIRVQNYFYNTKTGLLSEVSAAQGADFVNVDSSNRDHIDQDAQTEIVK